MKKNFEITQILLATLDGKCPNCDGQLEYSKTCLLKCQICGLLLEVSSSKQKLLESLAPICLLVFTVAFLVGNYLGRVF